MADMLFRQQCRKYLSQILCPTLIVLLLVSGALAVAIPEAQDGTTLQLADGYVMAIDNRQPGQLTTSIYLTTGAGEKYLQLTDGSAIDRVPDISPDGERVAFVSNRNGNEDIFVMQIDGSNLRQITSSKASESYPRFSPNGKQIAFFSNRHGTTKIFAMPSEGAGVPTQITAGEGNDFDPAFSPDGTAIYFTSDRSGTMQIYRISLADHSVKRVTHIAADAIHGSISNDGNFLLYRTNQSGNFEIDLMDLRTGNVRQISRGPGSKRHPSFGQSDKFAFYQTVFEAGKAEIWATELATGKQFEFGQLSGASLNPSVRRSSTAALIEEVGREASCKPAIVALGNIIGGGIHAVRSFVRHFKLFRPVCSIS